VGPSPAGLEVVSLFVSFDTIPAGMVQAIVCADGFDDVTCLAVTAFATVYSFVLTWCHCSLVDSIIAVRHLIRQPPDGLRQLSPANTPRYDSSSLTILAADVKGCGFDFPAPIM
jgi:hypothetical protein